MHRGSTNTKGSEEFFDPKMAFVVDLPKSDVWLCPLHLMR